MAPKGVSCKDRDILCNNSELRVKRGEEHIIKNESEASKHQKRIRVLQLGSPAGLYGAERWILALIKHLNVEKIESWVASVKDDPDQEVPLCVEAKMLGFQSFVFKSFGKINFSAVKQLRCFIRDNYINILHTHGYKSDMLGLLATMGTSCKIISTPHGWSKQPNFELWCYELLDRCVFPFFNAVVPLSDEMIRPLRRLPGMKGKLRLIRNAVDISEVDKETTVAEEMASWKKEGNAVIGYIGRLIPDKGLDVLLEALGRYGQPNWRLAIIGEGEHLPELKALARNLNIEHRVAFFGFRRDRIALLKGFDVFVLPSRSEGTPRCVMESMAAGVPVVVTDIPGCRYLVDGEKNGLLFQVDHAEQLAQAITRIVSDSSLGDKFIRNGREFIESQYSALRLAREYSELFINLTEHPKPDIVSA
jgi:glycosyltransferase involved in cell wall biosynthesis